MGVRQLDQPGFAVNDIAVRDPRLNDLVPAGDCVRQMDDTVGISGIGAGLVAGIGGIVAIAQVPDGEFYSSQRLAGDGVVLGDGEALTGARSPPRFWMTRSLMEVTVIVHSWGSGISYPVGGVSSVSL